MLVTIVALFVLCWLPLQTFLVVLNYTEVVDHNSLNLTFFICHWIAMSNSFVNPIVYGTLNDSFRADAKNIFCRCLGSNQPKPSSSSRHQTVKFRRAKSLNTYGKQTQDASSDSTAVISYLTHSKSEARNRPYKSHCKDMVLKTYTT
ncbi:NPFF2-like protein [Mya arenaria]|uniref:NPFF2-like protein n=2 Tax=Mya arenaria TaxID=6604 RepID=A0ABY7DE78_MYAAR|nr:NPFF2-like protein [Mya arenaria]